MTFHAPRCWPSGTAGSAVMAGDGQVTLRRHGRQAAREEDPAAVQRPHPRRLRRVGRRFLRAVLAVRSEARAVPRQPRALGRGAREGLAHRSHPPPARGDAHRAGQDGDVPAVGQRRSHRARRWHRRDRIGRRRTRWPRRRRSRRTPTLDARAIAEQAMAIAGDDLHLHERHARPSKSCRPCPSIFPKRPTSTGIADAAADRRRARQVRRRPGSGEARRRDRAAQPHAAPEAAAGDGRGDRAEEHPDDRADRRRQDRDRAPARAAGAVAVPQGRGVEVHRGRLRRPRRRVDGARPGRSSRVDMVREERTRRCARRRRRTPRSGCSTCCCRRCPLAPSTTSRPSPLREQAQRRRASAARAAPRRPPRREAVEIDVREKSFPSFEIIAGSSVEEVDINLKDMLPGLFQGRTKKRAHEGARGARRSRAGRRAEADRHGQRGARGGRARASRRGSSSSTRSTRSPGREGGARPRRQPRRRAARHPADRRRHDGQHEIRDGADRSHPVHRRRRVPRVEAVGSHSRAAGPLSDPRRARGARPATSSCAS